MSIPKYLNIHIHIDIHYWWTLVMPIVLDEQIRIVFLTTKLFLSCTFLFYGLIYLKEINDYL